MEGGKSANYWPGFVDALTNVVIAMVFVIVVLAIALSFAAQMMGKKMADELVKAKAAVAAAAASAVPAPAVTSQAAADTPASTQATDTLIEVRARAPAAAASAAVRDSGRSLRLEFADTALALDVDALKKLQDALAPHRAGAAGARVQITATGPSMALSDNQRSAYIRVLAVRNELIDAGFAAERIGVQIQTTGQAARATVTVSFPPTASSMTLSSASP
jgi:hypothetical protein